MAQHAQTEGPPVHQGAPLGQRTGSPLCVSLASDEKALVIEVVVDFGVN